jgi:hypothetical protein
MDLLRAHAEIFGTPAVLTGERFCVSTNMLQANGKGIKVSRIAIRFKFPRPQMFQSSTVIRISLLTLMIVCSTCKGQLQSQSTETEVWPEVDGHIQFASNLRVLAFTGLEQGVEYPFQQWYAAAALGYQVLPILTPHMKNIDPDKEHYFLFGGGYEFLRTDQSGKIKHEDRITLDATSSFRLHRALLVRDRNWVELRWIDGAYSTTYRNRVTVERDFLIDKFSFTPYGSVEVFYDGSSHSWNQEWYTAGIQLPYKRLWMLNTYYRRENCDNCNPGSWNAAGVSVNFYFRSSK